MFEMFETSEIQPYSGRSSPSVDNNENIDEFFPNKKRRKDSWVWCHANKVNNSIYSWAFRITFVNLIVMIFFFFKGQTD
jgi:hypothetical protein